MRPQYVFLRLVLVMIAVLGASCGGEKFPTEDHIPEEAFWVYPGAELVESEFSAGYYRRHLDYSGGSGRSTLQGTLYLIEGVSQETVSEWYQTELEAAGWQVASRDDSDSETLRASLEDLDAGLAYSFRVSFSSLGENGDLQEALPGDVLVQFRVTVAVQFYNPLPPVAVADETSILNGSSVDIDVLANDSDPDNDLVESSLTITTQPSVGMAKVGEVNGELIVSYSSDDSSLTETADTSFTYQVCDEIDFCSTASVTVRVTPTSVCTVMGTDGPDILVGTDGDDLICGFGGDDVIDAGAGDDLVFGGLGDDSIDGGAGDDVLRGNWGDDALNGGSGDDVMWGGAGFDYEDGGPGNNECHEANHTVRCSRP